MRIGLCARDALLRARAGRVVSAYARAVNLRLETGDLVTLLPRGAALHPWAVELDGPLPGLAVGTGACISGSALAIGPFEPDLAGAQAVDLGLASRPQTTPPAISGGMLEDLTAGGYPVPTGTPDQMAGESIAAALEAFLQRGDITGLGGIIGLGHGLTPSGDDVVVGVLCGLDLATGYCAAAGCLRAGILRALPQPIESATTILSAQMLRAAGEGQYPEPLHRLACVFAASDASSQSVDRAVSGLLAVGHRSGGDMLRGFCAGVQFSHGTSRTPSL